MRKQKARYVIKYGDEGRLIWDRKGVVEPMTLKQAQEKTRRRKTAVIYELVEVNDGKTT